MNEVTVASFRCFNEEQTALLAPLTILVGENSTGKTSFLALLRALWDIAFHEQLPDFKESPYDLGSFDEIAHYRSGRGGRASNFRAGFSHGTTTGPRPGRSRTERGTAEYRFTFRRDRLGLFPSVRRVAVGPASAEFRVEDDGAVSVSLAVADRSWKVDLETPPARSRIGVGWQSPQRDLVPLGYLVRRFFREVEAAPERVHCTNGTAEPRRGVRQRSSGHRGGPPRGELVREVQRPACHRLGPRERNSRSVRGRRRSPRRFPRYRTCPPA